MAVNSTFDMTIIGGGIVGLATAMTLSKQYPHRKLLLLEKEPALAMHQSGRNSGVIHSGIYYRPGSLKAKLCREGAELLLGFCQKHGIPHRVCGKVIIATHSSEVQELEALYQRGCLNGVKNLALIGPERLREIEPHASGLKAIHVPETAIVDFGQVAQVYAELSRKQGVHIQTSTKVEKLFFQKGKWVLQSPAGDYLSRFLINCGGLHADRIASFARSSHPPAIIPFRGEYYEIVPARSYLVKSLIYPVPNPLFPFLGAHFTRTISGSVMAGPNAVLALKREGYKRTDFNVKDVFEILRYPGFWRMVGRYGWIGLEEFFQSLSKKIFVKALQRLLPEIAPKDLIPGGSGVRAQAVARDGSLLTDFYLVKERYAIHVLNVPSPAATASLRIGEFIAETAEEFFFSSP